MHRDEIGNTQRESFSPGLMAVSTRDFAAYRQGVR
jgi:hypothetical protein